MHYAASKIAVNTLSIGLAEAVLWLLSPAASYTVGAVLEVGGGR
ncbi:hypothetical protein GCM10022222_46390 [Amycolatopsis ultiminotia]|uniref:Uncharacterized protein n=1 Tax=Amycolatopsis ultiminotia TaxID=543629 RepID=A0ABP6WVX3_9PSEU